MALRFKSSGGENEYPIGVSYTYGEIFYNARVQRGDRVGIDEYPWYCENLNNFDIKILAFGNYTEGIWVRTISPGSRVSLGSGSSFYSVTLLSVTRIS